MNFDPKQTAHVRTIIFVADAGAGHRARAESLLAYIPREYRNGVDVVSPYREIMSRLRFPYGRLANIGEVLSNLSLCDGRATVRPGFVKSGPVS